jgi:hypothetical protein
MLVFFELKEGFFQPNFSLEGKTSARQGIVGNSDPARSWQVRRLV